MIAIAFWSLELAALVSMVGGFVVLVRRNEATGFDIGSITVPFVLYLALALLNLSPKSLSNLIEPLALLPLIAVIFAVRTFAKVNIPHGRKDRLAFLIAVMAPILLYFFVPLLPE